MPIPPIIPHINTKNKFEFSCLGSIKINTTEDNRPIKKNKDSIFVHLDVCCAMYGIDTRIIPKKYDQSFRSHFLC